MKQKVYIAIRVPILGQLHYATSWAYVDRDKAVDWGRDTDTEQWPIYELTIDIPDPPESAEHKAWREAREAASKFSLTGTPIGAANIYLAGWDAARPEPK
jgi:hypothetical protein